MTAHQRSGIIDEASANGKVPGEKPEEKGRSEWPGSSWIPRHKVLKLNGQEVKLLQLGRMPAQLIIDKGGRVRFVHYGHSMGDIPSNAEIWGLLDEINKGIRKGEA